MKIYAKKSLGQNFLTSQSALKKIIDSAELTAKDIVLEIGPGKGALTEKILEKAGKVIAIEKDSRLISFLQEKFPQKNTHLTARQEIKIIEGDALTFLPESENLKRGKYKIVANIPYYITGQFLRRYLSEVPSPKVMVLMLQKEVAERIVARNGKENLLSISVKTFGTPKLISVVKKGSFFPAPNVDSAILRIDINSDLGVRHPSQNLALLFDILHIGFGHKRKILAGNLAEKFGSREKIDEILKKLNLNPKTRAEDLKVEDWKRLAEKLK